MSMWSTFYSGNIDRFQSFLEKENWEAIENAQDIRLVDFSGGVLQPFLIGDNFDPLVLYLKENKAVDISKFTDSFNETIWGEEGRDAEYQAAVLDTEFVRSLGNLSDESLTYINKQIIQKYTEEMTEFRKKVKGSLLDRIMKRIKIEICFAAFPVAISGGIIQGNYPVLAKTLVPLCSFGLVYGLRLWLWRRRKEKMKQKPEQRTYDWIEQLIQLRNFAKEATEKNEKVVYLWSL